MLCSTSHIALSRQALIVLIMVPEVLVRTPRENPLSIITVLNSVVGGKVRLRIHDGSSSCGGICVDVIQSSIIAWPAVIAGAFPLPLSFLLTTKHSTRP